MAVTTPRSFSEALVRLGRIGANVVAFALAAAWLWSPSGRRLGEPLALAGVLVLIIVLGRVDRRLRRLRTASIRREIDGAMRLGMRDRFREAEEGLERALRLAAAGGARAEVLERLGDVALAEGAVDRAAELYGRALEVGWGRWLDEMPRGAALQARLALALAASGRCREAREHLARVPASASSARGAALVAEALVLRLEARWDDVSRLLAAHRFAIRRLLTHRLGALLSAIEREAPSTRPGLLGLVRFSPWAATRLPAGLACGDLGSAHRPRV